MLVATQDRQPQVEVLTPCTRQYDRFVDPQGRPLQPCTVIFCDDPPFVVSANGRKYNYRGGNMKQIYIADPREHKFLVNEANRPGAIANVLGSVLRMLPGFHNRQNSTTHNPSESDEQVSATPEASTIETASMINNNSAVNSDSNTENKGNTIHNNTNEINTENECFSKYQIYSRSKR